MSELILTNDHRYLLDGRQIDGLTSTISEAGLIGNFGTEWHMDKGSAIHLATERWDKGTLDEFTVDPQIQGYLESWKRFRKDQGYAPIHIELKLYDPIYLYAGTIDRLPLCDLKSGAYEKWHRLQLAGYWNLCKINGFSDQCSKPLSIYLDKNGSSPKIVSYSQQDMRKYLQEFLCLLASNRIEREYLK